MCNRQIPQELLLWSYFRLTCLGSRIILKGHNITHQLTAEVCILKGKGEVAAVQVVKAHTGYIALRICTLGIKWRWVIDFTPRPLYCRKNTTPCQLLIRMGGSQSRSGRCGEKCLGPA